MSSFLEIVYALYFKDLVENIKIGLALKVFERLEKTSPLGENSDMELHIEEVLGYPFEIECKLLGKKYPVKSICYEIDITNWNVFEENLNKLEKYKNNNLDIFLYLNKEENNNPFGLLSIEILNDPENKSKLFLEKISDMKVFDNLDKNVFDFKVLSKICREHRISISLLDSYRFHFAVTTLEFKN